MKVYIFNPENDMALAEGHPGYTPPALIQQMRRELWWMPNWWAKDDDIVWNGTDKLTLQPGDEILPWGWSPALVHQLRSVGVTDEFLPTKEQLDRIRQLSHRATAVGVLRQMRDELPLDGKLTGKSVLCQTADEVSAFLEEYPDAILKSPWSSSGRGLCPTLEREWKQWCENTIRKQGSVVAERRLHKLADFALEFWLDGNGGVEYRGLSLFYTNDQGAYLGNWVAPEGQKFQWLMQYVNPQHLMAIRQWWEQHLTTYDYRGPVGIDMMLAEEGLCPCIEINWRMTMGLISCILTKQGKFGRLVLEYIYDHFSAEVEAFS